MMSNLDNSQTILKVCGEIDTLESEADRVLRSAMSKLFRDEAGYAPAHQTQSDLHCSNRSPTARKIPPT